MTGEPVPVGWRLAQLGDVAVRRKHALVIGPFGSDLKTSDYRDEGVPIVFVRDVQPNSFSPTQRRYVSEQKARELAPHAVVPGDLVVTKMGFPPCVSAVYPETERPGIVTADIIKLSVDEAVADRDYVARFLNSQLAQRQIRAMTFGITRPKVTLRDFKQLQLPLPPLPEQRRIAEVLDRAEALRAKRRAALAQLDTLTQAIFLDLFGDPITNPKGWPEKAIGELCEVKGGKRLPKGEEYSPTPTPFRYIRVTDLRGGIIEESALVFLKPEIQAKIARYVVKAGDVIISIAGSIGVVAPVPASVDGANLTENAARLTPRDKGQYSSVYLAHILRMPALQGQIGSQIGQVTIGKLALFRIEKLRVPLPPLTMQNEFALRVASVEKLKFAQRASLAEMDALFASLQHRAFRGEL